MSGINGLQEGTQRPKNLTDLAFAGLPIPGMKKRVEEITTTKNAENILNDILEGKLTIISTGKKSRYIDSSSGYYIYNLQLSDKTEIDIIFYSYTNEKLLVKINNQLIEISGLKDNNLLSEVAKIYPLPVYTQDAVGGVRLIAS